MPYAGGAPVVNALLGNQVTAGFVNYSEAVQQIKAGKSRAIATSSSQRIKQMPDLPTVAESGYPGYESEVWFSLLTGQDAEEKHRATDRLVHRCDESAGGRGKIIAAQPLSSGRLRKRIRCGRQTEARRICTYHSRHKHQGRMTMTFNHVLIAASAYDVPSRSVIESVMLVPHSGSLWLLKTLKIEKG